MHIHNIMSKIGCNSRNNIIEFIEKSNKVTLVKQHYADLLIKGMFELELKKFSSKTKNNINCLILYHKKERVKNIFVNTLEKHLNIAGIHTKSKVWGKNQFETTSDQKIYRVDFVLSVIFAIQI